MAVSSPSLQTNFYAASSSKLSFVKSDWCKQFSFRCKKSVHSAWIIKSVMNDKESSLNGDEAIEPTRTLLERLFAQTQKLEGQDLKLELNLGSLESDLQAALIVLKDKVGDLEIAENKLLSEYRDLSQAKEDLDKREEAIKYTFFMQEKLEHEVKQANLDLAVQATEIENLKLQLENQDKEVTAARSAVELKQNEIDNMVKELKFKTEEAANNESELRSKSQLLVQTKELLNKQTLEIEQLKKTVEQQDEELQIAATLFEFEEEKLKVVEGNLEKQTMDWLLAHEELKNLADKSSRSTVEVNENLQEFTKVKKLLADVRLELVSSRESLTSSRNKMEYQQVFLEKKLLELEQHRESLSSYLKSLGDAEVEVKSGRLKLRQAEAENQELQRDLAVEKDVVKELQNQLNDEKRSLLKATEEMLVLRDELEQKKSEYQPLCNALESKESQLVEAKLEIQHLKSKKAFLELELKAKESELSRAQEMLSEVNQEIRNLKTLLSSRENELSETAMMLKEKDEQVEKIQNEQKETKLKYIEVTSVIERIFQLTNQVVSSIEQEEPISSKQKELETELDLVMETLRSREMEVLATRRALTIKETEHETALNKLKEQSKEMKEMKQELTKDADEMRKLYEMAQRMIGEQSVGELAVEKLQLEAAQLEVEAATSALEKITEMSRDLLRTTTLLFDADCDLDVSTQVPVSEKGCFTDLKTEVARLSDLTQKLLQEAGISGADDV